MLDGDFVAGANFGFSLLGTRENIPPQILDESDEFFNGLDETALRCHWCGTWEPPANIDEDGWCKECS